MSKRDKIAIFVVLLVVIVITSVVTWRLVTPSGESDELRTAKSKIGKLIILPENEEPTLAVVEKRESLKDEFLKKNAKENDQILIYSKLGQAIIYRPSANKIVTIAPVTIDAALAQATDATISVRNGTSDATIANELKAELIKKYPGAKVQSQKANRTDYQTSIVVDNNDTKDNLFVQILDYLKASRGVIPLGEPKASTDIVIIIGKDYLESKRI